jgi:hypothetical protein
MGLVQSWRCPVSKRGRRDGDERRPRHRLFWAGGLKEVGDHYILALPCPCQNKGAAASCLTVTPRPPIVALRGATAAIGSISESRKSVVNTALAEKCLVPHGIPKRQSFALGRKKATQRNRASHCSVDLRGCRTNYSSCAKNNFEEVVHGHGVVDYPTKQCAKRQTNIFMER